MTLLIVSLLLTAMAPVMTKKSKETLGVSSQTKAVYLTDPGTFDWTPPQGVTDFVVTTVGAGGGGGAGMAYGCAVFTTTETPSGSIFADDSYCTHYRGDGGINFTLPQGVEEIYVSLVAGAGGGAAGQANYIATDVTYTTAGSYSWSVPDIVKGNRVLVRLLGAGGGGGGSDQGGGGGGASGGWLNWSSYTVPVSTTTIPVVVGGGGGGGFYAYDWSWSAGAGGFNGGSTGSRNGGGGGGATTFNTTTFTAYGGGGGAGQGPGASGWWQQGEDINQTVFNTGGSGRTGGTTGPWNSLGGKSGGDGAAGGGVAAGGAGANGTVGADNRAFGTTRGGQGGGAFTAWSGAGGRGQDYMASHSETNLGAGGAGGGGGGSALSAGTSAPTGCRGPGPDTSRNVAIAKAGTGAGGAGASCGWSGGSQWGGAGGDGAAFLRYLQATMGGTGGQDGPVMPRSRVALSSAMRSGQAITVTVGRGGAGGDAVIAYPNGDSTEIRTINSSNAVASTTSLTAANGVAGTESTVSFGATSLARTGSGGCGGSYTTNGGVAGPCGNYGTTAMDGTARAALTSSWHGHQSSGCSSWVGTVSSGGRGTTLFFDSVSYCGALGGTATSRNGSSATNGLGGGGGYPTGRGGKGGDGYVKIEWGIPRNLDKTTSVKYSGGGGSAGETIAKRVVKISPIAKTVRYTVGAGGAGAVFNASTSRVQDGSNGGNTVFGVGETWAVTAKGGLGGKSARVTSTIDSFSSISTLTGAHGAGALSNCTAGNDCPAALAGSIGLNGQGGRGGASSTGTGGVGGTSASVNGNAASAFDGVSGGGGGGGGGAAGTTSYGQGGNGANGYIKIEWK